MSGGSAGGAAILLYHSIAERAHDRWKLAVAPHRWRSQVSVLAARYRTTTVGELARRHAAGALEPGTVAVSFDDGYRDNLTTALPILVESGVPATFFLSGPGAAEGETFWWEVLEAIAERDAMSETDVASLHAELMPAAPVDRGRRLRELGAGALGPLPPRLDGAERRRLAASPGVEIGAHGWSHRALGPLADDLLRREIADDVGALRAETGQPIEVFAYPFGGPFDDRAVATLRAVGVRAACTVVPAPVAAAPDPWRLPRFEVGDWEGEELADRLAAWIG